MKKRNMISFGLALIMILSTIPLATPAYASDGTITLGNLVFENTVSQEQIDRLTPDQIAVLEQEVNGPIVSISPINEITPYSVMPKGYLDTDIVISRESYNQGDLTLKCVAMATWEEVGQKEANYGYDDYMILSWSDHFELDPNGHTAYIYYHDPETGDRWFEYDTTTLGDATAEYVWYEYPTSLSDKMYVLSAVVYLCDTSSGKTTLAANSMFYHTRKHLNWPSVTVSWPPALTFDGSSTTYWTQSGYATYRY